MVESSNLDPDGNTPDFNPDDYRPCWSCGSLVRVAATQCRFCGATLTSGDSLPKIISRVSRRLQNAQRLEEAGDFPHTEAARIDHSFRRRVRWCLLGAFFLLMVFFIIKVPYYQRHNNSVLSFIYWFCSLGMLVLPLWAFITTANNFRIPGDSKRATAAGGFRAFFHSLRLQRWQYAFACILPLEEVGEFWKCPKDPEMKTRAKTCFVKNNAWKSFRNYWQPIFCGRALFLQSHPSDPVYISAGEIEIQILNENAAIGVCQYVMSYSNRHAFNVEKFRQTMTKHLVRVGERWYLLNGEWRSEEDMLAKLYPGEGELDRLYRGELPREEVMRQAAQTEGLSELFAAQENENSQS